ncbi:MAG: acyl-CoA dehydrogenase family protein, partial [Solirubrobacterales bacterium]
MSDPGDRVLLEQSAERLFSERCGPAVVEAAEAGHDAELWELVERSGFTLAGLPEAAGGSGDLHDAAAIVRIAARHA